MAAGEWLRRLDRKVIPRIGRALAWFLTTPVKRRAFGTAGVFATTGLLAASVWAAHEPPVTDDEEAASVLRVGPVAGQSVGVYASEASRELVELNEEPAHEWYALVSFEDYLPPERVATVLSAVSVHRLYARAVVPDVDTDVVEITVPRTPAGMQGRARAAIREGMRSVAQRKATEAEAYRRDAARLTGPSRVERDRRNEYREKAEISATEADAYRSMCSCVYAAVVRGTPQRLSVLAGAPDVRTLDPAPEVSDLRSAVFVAPLPDGPDTVPSSSPSGTRSAPPSSSDGSSTRSPERGDAPASSSTTSGNRRTTSPKAGGPPAEGGT